MSTQDEAVATLYKQVKAAAKRRTALENEMLVVLERIKVIWDREGIGSDESESEPLFHALERVIDKAKGLR